MFKRILPSLAAVVALAALLVPASTIAQVAKSRLQKIQESGVLRVGTTGDYSPMSFRDAASGEFRGHQIDAANDLAKELGVKVEFVLTDWKTIVTAIQSDKFDIAMTGTSMSTARSKVAGWSIPWGKNAFYPLVQKKNAAKFKSWESLNDPKVTAAYNLGTTFEQFVQTTLPKVTVRRVESPTRDYQELIAGKVDFTVASVIEGAQLVKQYPQLQLILLDKPKNSIPMSFLLPIEDQQWINFVNNWIVIKKENGFFNELNQKWNVIGQ